jgi:hypothetical protein
MKRLLISTLAVLTAASPLVATSAAADPPGWRHDGDYRDRDRDGRNDRWIVTTIVEMTAVIAAATVGTTVNTTAIRTMGVGIMARRLPPIMAA